MSAYLLDTNILSELLRKRPSPRVLERLHRVPANTLATSSICVMELRYGVVRRQAGESLWARIAGELLPRLRILPLGPVEAERAGEILAILEAKGETIGIEDVLIGATAAANGLTMVTRNIRHFERIEGLNIESWWDE